MKTSGFRLEGPSLQRLLLPMVVLTIAAVAADCAPGTATAHPNTMALLSPAQSAPSPEWTTPSSLRRVNPSPLGTAESSPVFEPSLSPAPQTAVGRTGHTATLLRDGRVLIAGGQGGTKILASAELYDPKTGKFTLTGSLETARTDHTATLLADGRVLIAGGYNSTQGLLNSVELYDPKTGTFSSTKPMTTARSYQTATLLRTGRVLLIGGVNSTPATAPAELYDPATGAFSATGSMTATEYVVTATLLATGSVVVTGSLFDMTVPTYRASAEVYDPASGTFRPAGPMSALRFGGETATLLSSGQILIVAGYNESGFPEATAELYDPTAGSFHALGTVSPRSNHTATLLQDGRVLIAGGLSWSLDTGGSFTASAEIYDPASGRFVSTGSMMIARRSQTATLLPDGRVLIAGGEDDDGGIGTLDPASTGGLCSLPSAELYDPVSGTFSPTGSMTDAP